MDRRPRPPEEILSGKDLAELQHRLSMMSVTAVQDFYQYTHSACRIFPGHFPSAGGHLRARPGVETDAEVAVIYWDSGRKAEWKGLLIEALKSRSYHAKTSQGPLRYLAFVVSVALFGAFQAAQTAQGLIDRLRFDGVKAGDVAQFFEPCRNFNSCISDSPCDLGILQFHHRHSVKVYPKLFIRIRHTFAVPTALRQNNRSTKISQTAPITSSCARGIAH
jgi:hypothetical protein